MVADVGRGLLPGLNEDVLLVEQLQAWFELLWNHASAPQHPDQFRDHLQLASSAPVSTTGSKSGLTGSRVIFTWRQESPSFAFSLL